MVENWLRYSCQLRLPGFDQSKLKNSRVLVAGAGGLGCPVLQYLTGAGIGMIGVADFDVVSVTNLHRQLLYTANDTGKSKVAIVIGVLRKLNSEVNFIAHDFKIIAGNVIELISAYDIIVDCTDNIETKYLLNDACVIKRKPLVYGSIYQYEGHIAVWNYRNEDGSFSPNYRDIFPDINSAALPACSDGGVLPSLAGTIGAMQASEVIKIITGCGEILAGRLMLYDSRSCETRIIKTGNISKVRIDDINTSGAATVSRDDLKKMLEDNSVELVDVRENAERDRFHIGGKHIPVDEIAEFKPSGGKIVLYCESGRRSEAAVLYLRRLFPGLEFYSLSGGLNAWQTNAER
jgi:adenylyltransferase/sulfurtransferase